MPSSDNTPLYQEALIEVKKFRDLAKKEAEKSILERFSPMVDEIINKEMSGATVIFEQEEDPTALPLDATAPVAAPAVGTSAAPQMPATAPMDMSVTPPVGDMNTSTMPPVDAAASPDAVTPMPAMDSAVPPVTNGGSLAIPVPGPDGKITVDIEALFAATPEGSAPNFAGAAITPAAGVPGAMQMPPEAAPEALPAPSEEVPALALAETFEASLGSLEEEFFSELSEENNLSENKKDILRNKIFALYEMAQKAKISKEISRGVLALGEVHMELMFAKLKESAKQVNSYNRQTTIKEDSKMAKKEFNTLKEFAVSLFAEEVEAKGHSGFDGGNAKAGVTNTTTLKDETAKKKSGDAGGVQDPGKEDSLKVGGAALAEGAEEEGTLESELMEMLSGMEEDSSEEEGEMPMMEVRKESIQKKLNALKEEQAKLTKALKECGMEGHSEPANVNIRIMVDDGSVSAMDTDAEEGSAGEENDDDMIEIMPDSDEEEDNDSLLGSHDDEESTEEEPSEDEEEVSAPMVAESKVSKENKKLRVQLAETQLLTARSLFVNKLFAEHNLSVGTKQKIVEYIDSAQTVEEAKTKFVRVKRMLEESAKPTFKTGSSSRPSTTGAPTLNENASPLMKLEMNPNRWMHLAGISKKSI